MSEHLQAARMRLTWHSAMTLEEKVIALRQSIHDTVLHLEAQEQRPPLSNVLTSEITPESLERLMSFAPSSSEPTPSVSTSPQTSGAWLSASDIESLGDWLQRFRPLMTTGGCRLTVQPGSVTFSRLVGGGSLTIPTGTPEPPITSGSEQGEPGDPGQAPAAAEHGSFEMCNAYIFTDQVPGPQCMLQKGHRGFCSPPPRESRKEGTR